MGREMQQTDVCIVCALPEEVRAMLRVVEKQCLVTFTERISPHYQYEYRATTITNHKGEPLELHLSWLPRYGPQGNDFAPDARAGRASARHCSHDWDLRWECAGGATWRSGRGRTGFYLRQRE